MRLRLGAFAGLAVVVVVIVAFAMRSCGEGSNGGQPTDVPLPTNNQGTPYAFAAFRDQFAERLESIGPNVGFVPLDVRRELFQECERLSVYLVQEVVVSLCTGISRSIEGNDPDLLAATIRQLRALEGN